MPAPRTWAWPTTRSSNRWRRSWAACVPDDERPAFPRPPSTGCATLTASRGWEASDADDLLRSELYSSVVEALAWAASVRPVVLVLEDLHWAGPAGRDLLRYVVSRTDDQPLLILATMRNTPPDRSSGAERDGV